jgi:hypothetical protein
MQQTVELTLLKSQPSLDESLYTKEVGTVTSPGKFYNI